MILDEKLLKYNKAGFIPGPYENEEIFLKRIEYTKKLTLFPKDFFKEKKLLPPFNMENRVLKPRWNWIRARIIHLYDVSLTNLPMFYNDEKLSFYQAAATWILNIDNVNLPILQFRKVLKDKPYFFIYTLDEILAHEAIHSIRCAFNEPRTEEIFSYMTASSYFRRVFGPIIQDSKEVLIFFGLMSTYFIFQVFYLAFDNFIFNYIALFSAISTLAFLGLGLIRLFFRRRKFSKAFKKFFKLFKNASKARGILLRLTDQEIEKFSKMKKEEIVKHFEKKKKSSLREKMIYISYFKN